MRTTPVTHSISVYSCTYCILQYKQAAAVVVDGSDTNVSSNRSEGKREGLLYRTVGDSRCLRLRKDTEVKQNSGDSPLPSHNIHTKVGLFMLVYCRSLMLICVC